jgi:hypothetical protein
MVSLDNRAGNKLDQFLPVAADVTHHPVAGGTEVVVTVRVANQAPDGLPRYVQGPYTEPEFVAGQYKGIVAVNVPLVSRDVHLDGVEQVVAAGPDQTTRVVAGKMSLLRGQSGTYTVRFTLPKGYEHLQVVPSARYPAIDYRAGAKQWKDDDPHALAW